MLMLYTKILMVPFESNGRIPLLLPKYVPFEGCDIFLPTQEAGWPLQALLSIHVTIRSPFSVYPGEQ